MKRSFPLLATGLIGAAMALSAYSGGGRVSSGPAAVPYVCEDGRPVSAVYEHGGDSLHAKVLLTFDGRTAELESAPALSGLRYKGEPDAEHPHAWVWSVRGERAWLEEATESHAAEGQAHEAEEQAHEAAEARPIARCTRLRSASAQSAAADPGHSPNEH